jgi:hypothetical protein
MDNELQQRSGIFVSFMYFIYDASKIYLLWISFHYFASQLYVPFCAPNTIIGFLLSPILASTPQCKALRWIINFGGNEMETMWLIFGLWITTKLLVSSKK